MLPNILVKSINFPPYCSGLEGFEGIMKAHLVRVGRMVSEKSVWRVRFPWFLLGGKNTAQKSLTKKTNLFDVGACLNPVTAKKNGKRIILIFHTGTFIKIYEPSLWTLTAVLAGPKFYTRWWFHICFYFHPYLGKWFPFWLIFFQLGWFNHQLVYRLYDGFCFPGNLGINFFRSRHGVHWGRLGGLFTVGEGGPNTVVVLSLNMMCPTTTYIWVFPKIVVPPKSSIFIGFSIINHPFWGTPILGNTHILF